MKVTFFDPDQSEDILALEIKALSIEIASEVEALMGRDGKTSKKTAMLETSNNDLLIRLTQLTEELKISRSNEERLKSQLRLMENEFQDIEKMANLEESRDQNGSTTTQKEGNMDYSEVVAFFEEKMALEAQEKQVYKELLDKLKPALGDDIPNLLDQLGKTLTELAGTRVQSEVLQSQIKQESARDNSKEDWCKKISTIKEGLQDMNSREQSLLGLKTDLELKLDGLLDDFSKSSKGLRTGQQDSAGFAARRLLPPTPDSQAQGSHDFFGSGFDPNSLTHPVPNISESNTQTADFAMLKVKLSEIKSRLV